MQRMISRARNRKTFLYSRARRNLVEPRAELGGRRQIDARPRCDADPPERLDVGDAIRRTGQILRFLKRRRQNGVEALRLVEVPVDRVRAGKKGLSNERQKNSWLRTSSR